MGKYRFQIGDRFRNSVGSLLEITGFFASGKGITYKYVLRNKEDRYSITRRDLADRLERNFYNEYVPVDNNGNIIDFLHGYVVKCDSMEESHTIQRKLFALSVGYSWTGQKKSNKIPENHRDLQIGSLLGCGSKTTIYTASDSPKLRGKYKEITGNEFVKLINNYLNNNQNAKNDKNKSEINRSNNSSNSRESGGTTVKIKGQAYRTSSSIRLSGNPIKIGRTKGKTRQLPVEGQVLSI